MTNIRRYYKKGNVYFLTHVTYKRAPLLVDHNDLVWQAIERISQTSSFDLSAWVILPDHMHLLIDPGDEDLSLLMRRVKLSFSGLYRGRVGLYGGRVWQNRYWDHVIRDRDDMNRHIDYIHYNPVKHDLVGDPFQWKYSSIHDYYERGYYARGWGISREMDFVGEFGE
ncbi:MAG: transposase [Candidatus Zixiibacteriota bacterium]|nr:MAG: transposase [candidate division Zixibacteria bacterium]